MVEELTQSAFIWDNFKVDVSLRIGDGDFSDAATSVCVLDFVLMLQGVRVTLREDRLAVCELSDRQGEWRFTRDKELIGLRTRYATREGWHFRPAEGHCLQIKDALCHLKRPDRGGGGMQSDAA
ncbi:hypothetical protein ACFXGR_27415 [Streptomyces mirabilis]|uniref:hypothetical protein n=1 Tax=Streptomyces mirabilis TaxID=68239 RepID=UPI003681C60B